MENTPKSFIKKLTGNRLFGVILVVVIMMIVLSIASPYFMTGKNMINLLNQTSMKAVLAMGMTFVIITAGIDLSVGAIVGLAAVIAADMLVKHGIKMLVPAILAALAVGAVCGIFNGFMISKFNLQPFLVTMGTLNIYRGIIYVYTNSMTIRGLPQEWIKTWFGKVPFATIIMFVVAVVAFMIIQFTRYGRYIYAIGGNENAAVLSGVNTVKMKIITYMICGIACAVTAIIYVGRMSSAEPNTGSGYELDAIAATAIGGTSMSGGRGNIIGAIIGAYILTMLMNGMTLLNIMAYYQTIATGVIIIIAVLVDKYATRG